MFRKKIISIILICLFFIPLLDGIFNLSPLFVTTNAINAEKRTLAPRPLLDINILDPFPKKYESYYNDHFMLRDLLTTFYQQIKINCFNISPFPEKAIIGKDGWLFLTGFNELETYTCSNRLTDDELKLCLKEFKRRKKYLEERNCAMHIFIVPTKLSVYPEYIGKIIKRKNEQTAGEQLTKYITKHSSVSIAYLLPDLLKAKNSKKPLLYYMTDNHWAPYGGYIGYRTIMDKLQLHFKELNSIEETELTMQATMEKVGSVANMIGFQEGVSESVYHIIPKNNKVVDGIKKNYPVTPNINSGEYEVVKEVKNQQLPKLLMIRDSFSWRLIPYVSQHFRHSTYIFDSWKYDLNDSIVNIEKPDVVVYEIYEPLLQGMLFNIQYHQNINKQ